MNQILEAPTAASFNGTSTSPVPISSVAVVCAVRAVSIPFRYRAYDVAPPTGSQENSPLVAERRVNVSDEGAMVGKRSHAASSAAQVFDTGQQN